MGLGGEWRIFHKSVKGVIGMNVRLPFLTGINVRLPFWTEGQFKLGDLTEASATVQARLENKYGFIKGAVSNYVTQHDPKNNIYRKNTVGGLEIGVNLLGYKKMHRSLKKLASSIQADQKPQEKE